MQDNEASFAPALKHRAWNKGKLIGAKLPLRRKHVRSICTQLQVADRKRDLAMFNLASDCKLRGSDVVALKVEGHCAARYAVERATVRQKETGVPVRFEVTEQTRQAVAATGTRSSSSVAWSAPSSSRRSARPRCPLCA